MSRPIIIIGSGIAGLVSAVELASAGEPVLVLERGTVVGGKIRTIDVQGRAIASGPTVMTMRWVFDQIFERAGARLDDHVKLQKLNLLARHAWPDGSQLDLFSDVDQSAAAIAEFAGAREADNYKLFAAKAGRIYDALEPTFINAQLPSMLGLVGRMGRTRPSSLIELDPNQSLWRALEKHFGDPRLRQLFGRYATYCGSSPFSATATLMLIAHVEQKGVWHVEGGLVGLAQALRSVGEAAGAEFRFEADVAAITQSGGRATGVEMKNGEQIAASAVIFNGDTAALTAGQLGPSGREAVARQSKRTRSLSAVTISTLADPKGFNLAHHNVFFSRDYRREFEDIQMRHQVPEHPTVYVCAQDRHDSATPVQPVGECTGDGLKQNPERLLCLINAPPNGDQKHYESAEMERCQDLTRLALAACGLDLQFPPDATVVTLPQDFAALFPATGGALYGRHAHGMTATFQRPGSRSKMPGLYLAGGSVHPGPGVPMAALSGRLATASLLEDRASTRRSHRVGIFGGTWMG